MYWVIMIIFNSINGYGNTNYNIISEDCLESLLKASFDFKTNDEILIITLESQRIHVTEIRYIHEKTLNRQRA